jgi:hypothetical protein
VLSFRRSWQDLVSKSVGFEGFPRGWIASRVLEDDPVGWYCYTAMSFVGKRVLLGHSAGDRWSGGLNGTPITSVPLDWLDGL